MSNEKRPSEMTHQEWEEWIGSEKAEFYLLNEVRRLEKLPSKMRDERDVKAWIRWALNGIERTTRDLLKTRSKGKALADVGNLLLWLHRYQGVAEKEYSCLLDLQREGEYERLNRENEDELWKEWFRQL